MKRTLALLAISLMFVGFVHAQKAKTVTGVIVDNILSNKWTAIVIKVGKKKFGIQTSRVTSYGDQLDGIRNWNIRSVGNTWDKGRRVTVFYTSVYNGFDSGVNIWLKATKIVGID